MKLKLKRLADLMKAGTVKYQHSQYTEAIRLFEEALEITKEMGHSAVEGQCYGYLGCVYESLGDFAKAIDFQRMHLNLAKKFGDRAGEGRAYGNLGSAYQSLGEYALARAPFSLLAPCSSRFLLLSLSTHTVYWCV